MASSPLRMGHGGLALDYGCSLPAMLDSTSRPCIVRAADQDSEDVRASVC